MTGRCLDSVYKYTYTSSTHVHVYYEIPCVPTGVDTGVRGILSREINASVPAQNYTELTTDDMYT